MLRKNDDFRQKTQTQGFFTIWIHKQKCYTRPFTRHTARRENKHHRVSVVVNIQYIKHGQNADSQG